MHKSKTCTRCGQIKTLDDFGNHAGHSDGKSSRCLICERQARAEYRKRQSENIKIQQADNYQRNRNKRIEAARIYLLDPEHRKKKNESGKRWQIRNKHLMAAYSRKRRMLLTKNTQYLILARDLNRLYNSPCIYCGSKELIEADHVIAVSKQGVNGIGNLVPACKKCNSSKQDLFIMEWRLKQSRK